MSARPAILQAKQFNAKLLVFHVINELEFPIHGIFPDHYVEAHKNERAAAADRMMKEFCGRTARISKKPVKALLKRESPSKK